MPPILLLASWIIAGWCGTPWRKWPPKPQPDPWWIKALGVVVAIGAGWAAYRFGVAGPVVTLTDMVATALVAGGAAFFVTDVVRTVALNEQVQISR